MIITRAMPTQQTAITGVSRRITAGQEIKAELCRGPEPYAARGSDVLESRWARRPHPHLTARRKRRHELDRTLGGTARNGAHSLSWKRVFSVHVEGPPITLCAWGAGSSQAPSKPSGTLPTRW